MMHDLQIHPLRACTKGNDAPEILSDLHFYALQCDLREPEFGISVFEILVETTEEQFIANISAFDKVKRSSQRAPKYLPTGLRKLFEWEARGHQERLFMHGLQAHLRASLDSGEAGGGAALLLPQLWLWKPLHDRRPLLPNLPCHGPEDCPNDLSRPQAVHQLPALLSKLSISSHDRGPLPSARAEGDGLGWKALCLQFLLRQQDDSAKVDSRCSTAA